MAISVHEAPFSSVSAFPRVLIIDEDPKLRAALAWGLANLCFEVRGVPDERAGANAIREWMPEAIVLNRRASNMNAAFFIKSLRRITDTPILVLSGHSDAVEKIDVLMRGADDFIAEPFEYEELAACIHTRLRRPRMENRDIIHHFDMIIDVTQRKVARGGKVIELSSREFDLLVVLARHPDQVFTKSQLLDLVWGVDRSIALATVETYISYLRTKIDAEGIPLIHTLRGVGYTMRARQHGSYAALHQ